MKYKKGHNEYFNKNNEEVPSVTTVIGILNKPAIAGWANHLGFKRQKYDDVLNHAANFGTEIHGYIENLLHDRVNDYNKSSKADIDSVYRTIHNFITFCNEDDRRPRPIFTEKQLSSDKFGGTVDFYGTYQGKKSIIDFKTSKKFRFTMFLQLALYTVLVEEQGYEVEQVGIIIANDNTCMSKFISREEIDKYIEVSLKLVEFFHLYYDLNEKEWGDDII